MSVILIVRQGRLDGSATTWDGKWHGEIIVNMEIERSKTYNLGLARIDFEGQRELSAFIRGEGTASRNVSPEYGGTVSGLHAFWSPDLDHYNVVTEFGTVPEGSTDIYQFTPSFKWHGINVDDVTNVGTNLSASSDTYSYVDSPAWHGINADDVTPVPTNLSASSDTYKSGAIFDWHGINVDDVTNVGTNLSASSDTYKSTPSFNWHGINVDDVTEVATNTTASSDVYSYLPLDRPPGFLAYTDNYGSTSYFASTYNPDNLEWVVRDSTELEGSIGGTTGQKWKTEFNVLDYLQRDTVIPEVLTTGYQTDKLYLDHVERLSYTLDREYAELTTDSNPLNAEHVEYTSISPAADPHWSNVKLFIDAEDSDGSTQIQDRSTSGHILYPGTSTSWPTSITTEKSIIGNSSIKLLGQNSGNDQTTGIKVGYSEDFSLQDQDFTMECWYNPQDKNQSYPRILQIGNEEWSSGTFSIIDRPDNYPSGFSVVAYNLITNSPIMVSSTNVCMGLWYHIAVTNTSGTLRLFINGKLESSYNTNGTLLTGTAAQQFTIGKTAINNQPADGYIDQIRFTKGVSRYTEDFEDYLAVNFPKAFEHNKIKNQNISLYTDTKREDWLERDSDTFPTLSTGYQTDYTRVDHVVRQSHTYENDYAGHYTTPNPINAEYIDKNSIDPVDPYFNNVKFLFDSDYGVSGDRHIIDRSLSSHPIEEHRRAYLTTSGQSPVGNMSLYSDGYDYSGFATPYSEDFILGNSDWTVELWYRPEAKVGSNPCIWYIGRGTPNTENSVYLSDRNDQHVPDKFSVWTTSFTGTSQSTLQSKTIVREGTWYHIAVTNTSGIMKLFINGNEEDIANVGTNLLTDETSPNQFTVGRSSTSSSTWTNARGYYDNIRFTKGISRYDESFTDRVPYNMPTVPDNGILPYQNFSYYSENKREDWLQRESNTLPTLSTGYLTDFHRYQVVKGEITVPMPSVPIVYNQTGEVYENVVTNWNDGVNSVLLNTTYAYDRDYTISGDLISVLDRTSPTQYWEDTTTYYENTKVYKTVYYQYADPVTTLESDTDVQVDQVVNFRAAYPSDTLEAWNFTYEEHAVIEKVINTLGEKQKDLISVLEHRLQSL